MGITKLPHLIIEQENEIAADSALMVLGGRAPSPAWLRELAFAEEVWAVDRGVEVCRAAEVVPHRLIGDCDSAALESWRWAEEKDVRVNRYSSDKDLTDFQLALDIFGKNNKNYVKKIFLTGAWGGRFDHLWSLILSFLNFSSPHIPFCVADENEGLVFMHGPQKTSFTFDSAPKAVSLLSFSDDCTGVAISGVRWPLKEAVLSYGLPFAISNRLDENLSAHVSCGSGILGFYWIWDEHQR